MTDMIDMPNMVTVRQRFRGGSIDDPVAETALRIRNSGLTAGVKPGMRIAVTAGSRGIHRIDAILRAVVDELIHAGAAPFIVPAMGSHGGGTSDGQRKMLESLGITETSMGVPILSDAESILIGETAAGLPVWCDRNARSADGIVAVNRIKPHTAYHGTVESGLCKMVVVGLGKKNGAETMHRAGLADSVVEAFRVAREELPLMFGVALIENARDEIMDIAVVPPEEFETADERFLVRAREIMPGIPLKTFDILIVDEMGKNISGTGMDTNVIGFWRRFGGVKDPDYITLIVLSLTPESHGNAMGIGLADLIPERLAAAIDRRTTWTNAMTSQWSMGRIPITFPTDRDCIQAALSHHEKGTPRVIRIKNTLELEQLAVSESCLPAIHSLTGIDIAGEPRQLAFDKDGALV